MRYLVLVVLYIVAALAAAHTSDQYVVEGASSSVSHYLRQLFGQVVAKGGRPGGGGARPAPRPAPAPAPRPAPAPAPRPAPAPAPAPAPRPAPGPAPRPAPAPAPGPRPPSGPVPRPAVAPSQIPYRPVTPVAYAQPVVARPIIVAPIGYSYFPVYVYPLYVWRPYIYISPVYWATNTCYHSYCYRNYQRCLFVYGDGCFCYPGLLSCLRSSCYSYYQPVYDQCNQALNQPSRCVLSCRPAAYPLTPVQAALPVPPAANAPVDTSTIVATTLVPTIAADIKFSVVTVVLLQGANSTSLAGAEYDFASGVAQSLAPVKSATIVRDNVTLQARDVIINSTAFLEVTIGVALPSVEAMNATDTLFQDMAYGNVTNGTLGQTLVANNVLFNATQLAFDEIKSNVFVASEDGDVVVPAPLPTEPQPPMVDSSASGHHGILSNGIVVLALGVGSCMMMVHTAILSSRPSSTGRFELHVLSDLTHLAISQKGNEQCLLLNRNAATTGAGVVLEDVSELNHAQGRSLTFDAIFGIYTLLRGRYLALVTESRSVGKFKVRGADVEVRQVTAIEMVLLPTQQLPHLTPAQVEDEERYRFMTHHDLAMMIHSRYMAMVTTDVEAQLLYFAFEYDLTHTLQRITTSLSPTVSIAERADPRFCWNYAACSFLLEKKLFAWVVPIMQCYVEVCKHVSIADNKATFDLLYISRRSCRRQGTRFTMRGIDSVRSIPVVWSSPATLKYAPKVFQRAQADTDTAAFQLHAEEMMKLYGRVILVNLIDKKTEQLKLGEAFEKTFGHASTLNTHILANIR
ncbi:hypothetical protein DYB36_002121 [Aphanomyces astaci]|uniref:SAC domain-containing protein n=1 Tax=Aphanomyces astaci TaxID=112090 RepID=A0A397BT21_APHAT|nr:hypothetical protein DYB36_002121 [Aphanomyces astaci]